MTEFALCIIGVSWFLGTMLQGFSFGVYSAIICTFILTMCYALGIVARDLIQIFL